MRIATIVGARPQFIKAALVSKALRKKHEEILIHTGQHYGPEMSDIFFEELGLPMPDYDLGIGSGPPGRQVGAMLMKLAKILLNEKPDLVLVYGDTHSTLAGALGAAQTNIPLAHVEAGLRSGHPTMQEEKNRVVTDHLSKLLFCPTKTAIKNLRNEGISQGIHLVGDVMVDSLMYFLPMAEKRSTILKKLGLSQKSYFLATLHRAENADNPAQLQGLFTALSTLRQVVVLPLHPRTEKQMKRNKISVGKNILLTKPIGYLDMLVLENQSQLILTDSGGVQKEAYLLRVPCVTLREETEWLETERLGWNIVAGLQPKSIHRACERLLSRRLSRHPSVFGNGEAGDKIAKILHRFSAP